MPFTYSIIYHSLCSWYFQWIFMSVNLAVEGRSDKMRAVYLTGFNEVETSVLYVCLFIILL